jgi:uncharacterized protein
MRIYTNRASNWDNEFSVKRSFMGKRWISRKWEKQESQMSFAKMDVDKQRAIASKGGKRAHELGVAHEYNSLEASLAGQKGGVAVSKDKAHMAEIGRKGGLARAAKAKVNDVPTDS